jgi:CheY-like chemotaxis protein
MKNILVVDDNRDGALSLKLFFEMLGHSVVVAHTGLEALDEARKLVPDFIFLDIGLPGMNGYEVARLVRSMPSGDRPKIIAVTGWGSEQDRKNSSDAGCNLHLTKPIDLSEVEKLLEGE